MIDESEESQYRQLLINQGHWHQLMSFSWLEAWSQDAEGAQIDLLFAFGGLVLEISASKDFDLKSFHFLIHGALAAKRLRLETFL